MPTKTNNTIVLLNFSNPSNPYKDECGNVWTIINNPPLIYDNYINKYALSLDHTKKQCLYTNINFSFSNNITIDGVYYNPENNNKIFYSRIFSLNLGGYELNLEHNVESSAYYHKFRIYDGGKRNGNNYLGESNNKFINEYFHFAITYNEFTKYLDLYFNGELNAHNYVDFTSCTCSKIALSNVFDLSTSQNYYCTGKLSYFRIEKDILFNQNFDSDIFIRNKISYNQNNNTKRMFAFTYGWDVYRETIWNQRVNMYVMGPNIYKKD